MDGARSRERAARPWTETTYGGETVPVIGKRHLIQNKRTSGRPQDLLDLSILES